MNVYAIFVASVVAFTQAVVVAGDKMPHVPTLPELATVWVGGGQEDVLEYFRLDLKDDGTGLMTVQYLPKRPAVAYAVTKTTLSRYRIRFEVEAVDPDVQPIVSIQGHALTTSLDLEIAGERPKWKCKVHLRRYSELMQRLDAVTRRARAHEERGRALP